jgi:hypothetical protein
MVPARDVDRRAEPPGLATGEVAHRTAIDPHGDRPRIDRVRRLGDQLSHRLQLDAPVRPVPDQRQELVLMVGLADHVDPRVAAQRDRERPADHAPQARPAGRPSRLSEQRAQRSRPTTAATAEAEPATADRIDVQRRMRVRVERAAMVAIDLADDDPFAQPLVREGTLLRGGPGDRLTTGAALERARQDGAQARG